MNIIAGIDEAGRGPLIGDMFMAMIVIEKDKISLLRDLGIRDSKKMSKNQREKLFPYIVLNSLVISVTRATPHQIDHENLNSIELKMICRLIKNTSRFYKINAIYIDAFSDPEKLKNDINNICSIPKNNLIIKYKADSEFLVVSAASIIAKVLRDNHIALLKRVYGDFGSGYPSDYRTISWLIQYLRKHNEIPPIVRKSWQTINKIKSLCDIYNKS